MTVRELTTSPVATELPEQSRADQRSLLSRVVNVSRDYGIVGSFALLFIILSLSNETFFGKTNLLNLLDQQSFILIVAAAGTLVLVGGGVDLSIGATFALAGVIGTKVALSHGAAFGIIAGLLAGTLVGLVNGALVTWGRITPLIGTLATSFAVMGLSTIVTGGNVIVANDPAWQAYGRTQIAGVTLGTITMIIFLLLCGFLLTRTTYGRRLFATGGNPDAAWLSGIRVHRIRTFTYVLSGFSAGLAGVLISSRVGTGQADSGSDLVFIVLAGIVVGGTSIMGGSGAIWRTALGVLFVAMINNGFTLLSLDPTYEQIVEGSLILLAVGIDAWSKKVR
jgi:ribose transport system permease protein